MASAPRVSAGTALAGVVARDLTQRQHAIRRNFPVLGRFRYWLEAVGPELRQYIVTSNDEERPFSRDQRRWVYASSKREINTFGFGTDNEVEQVDSLIVFKHTPFPVPAPAKGEVGAAPDYHLPAGKVLGAAHGRRARVPAGLAREHLRHELRLAVAGGRGGAQPRRRAGRLPAQHGRGRARAGPPPRRRADLPDRHGLLRLPRRVRPLLARAPAGADRGRARAGDRDQALPGRQARPRRPAPGGQGDRGDRPHPRRPGRARLREPVVPLGVLRRGRADRVRRADRGRDRPARGDQVRRRRPRVLGDARGAHGRHRRRARLRHRSTAAREAPAPRRWRSATTSRCRSSSRSRASIRSSPGPGSPRTWCSSAPAGSASRMPGCTRSRSAAT